MLVVQQTTLPLSLDEESAELLLDLYSGLTWVIRPSGRIRKEDVIDHVPILFSGFLSRTSLFQQSPLIIADTFKDLWRKDFTVPSPGVRIALRLQFKYLEAAGAVQR